MKSFGVAVRSLVGLNFSTFGSLGAAQCPAGYRHHEKRVRFLIRLLPSRKLSQRTKPHFSKVKVNPSQFKVGIQLI